MKIGVASVGCHRRGGIERVALETVNALANRGHEVRLVAYDADRSALDDRVALQTPRRPRGPELRSALKFPAVADAALGDGDDVRCGFGVLSAPGSVVWVTSVHARWLEVVRQGEAAASWKRRVNPFHPLMVRQSNRQFAPGFHRRLLAMGPAVAEDLQRFCGSDPRAIEVLPHGYDAAAFGVERAAGLRAEARAALGFADDDRVAVCVANEIDRKGVPTLIAAAARSADPGLRLLLVGRLDAATIQASARRHGLPPERLRIVPPQDDVARYYAAADVFALPTLYDAWGLVIVEALACGCPVITTDRAGAASVVEAGRSGTVLSDPHDVAALAAALEHWTEPKNRPERQAVAASVAALTWPRVIERYEQILEDVAAARAEAVPA